MKVYIRQSVGKKWKVRLESEHFHLPAYERDGFGTFEDAYKAACRSLYEYLLARQIELLPREADFRGECFIDCEAFRRVTLSEIEDDFARQKTRNDLHKLNYPGLPIRGVQV